MDLSNFKPSSNFCHADPPREDYPGGPNYGNPHIPVNCIVDNKPCTTCLFCGKYLQ